MMNVLTCFVLEEAIETSSWKFDAENGLAVARLGV